MKCANENGERRCCARISFFHGTKACLLVACIAMLLVFVGCSSIGGPSLQSSDPDANPLVVGIAWRPDSRSKSYKSVVDYFSDSGFEVVLLDRATTSLVEYYDDGTLSDANLNVDFSLTAECVEALARTCDEPDGIMVPQQLDGVDIVVFSGGEDISPTLYGIPFDIDSVDLSDTYTYNAERDVSDYLLMRYCLANDVPILGICRGMQMLAVANGYRLIEDIPTYYAEFEVSDPVVHRSSLGGTVLHDVFFEESDSHGLFDSGESFPVSSFHHQAVDPSSSNSPNVSFLAFDGTGDVRIVEAMEIEDMKFAMGLQFHMEYYIDHPLEPGAERSRFFIKALHSVVGML